MPIEYKDANTGASIFVPTEEEKQRIEQQSKLYTDVEKLNTNYPKLSAVAPIYVKDYGAIGDGTTDDYTSLQNAFNDAQGRTIILEKDKVYGIPNNKTLQIRDNITLYTNGAKFKKITTGSNNCINITGSNVYIDYLNYMPFPSVSETGLKISGNNVTIQTYESVSPEPNCGGESVSKTALFIYNSDTTNVTNITIGKVILSDWERNIQVRNASNIRIDNIDILNFKQGLYLRDVTRSSFNGAYVRGTSTTAIGNPGENGVLMEAYTDNATRDITVSNWVVEESAEHGYRVGGQSIVSDITFDNCVSRKPGRGSVGNGGSEAGIGHGGCGFKVLGSTSSTKRHRNIRYLNCTAENGRTDVASTRVNFAGFQVGKCINVVIENPIVRTNESSASARSFVNGIEIIGSEDVVISNPNIGYTTNNGIHIYDADQSTGDFGTLLSRVTVNGGLILNPVNAGIYAVANNNTYRRIVVTGTLLDTGASTYGVYIAKSGAGNFTGCMINAKLVQNTGTTSLEGADTWLVNIEGSFFGTNNCANGSMYKDTTNGLVKIRKGGAWTTL